MRKITLALFATFVSLSLMAQNDSTRLDAGGLVLKRNFTQHISIKGEDLEKMPFASLADAINVWINGAYTLSTNLIYVVDGNIISDVNAYSVHDVEEVVFLQNAGALTGTAGGLQEIVLITTRRGKDRLSLRGAAQTSLVNSPGGGVNLYHQYFARVDANRDKVSLSISANYLRDVTPSPKMSANTTVHDPLHMDRWRLNGGFTWRPDGKNTVEVHAGFVPQTMSSAENYEMTTTHTKSYKDRAREVDQQLNSWARWRGEWLPGLRNDLQAGYLHMVQKGMSGTNENYVDSPAYYNRLDSSNLHTHQFFVRDRLSYTMHAGNWSFEPAVNASYNYVKDIYTQSQFVQSGNGSPGTGGAYYTIQGEGGAGTLWVLTPTLDIGYKQVLNIQAGVVANVSKNKPGVAGVSLPGTTAFGSFAIDVLRLDGVSRSNSLKIFGSYAQRSSYYSTDFYINDLDGSNAAFRYGISTTTQTVFTSGNSGPITIPVNQITSIPEFWVWQAGATWTALQNRLQIDYNLQRRNLASLQQTDPQSGGSVYFYLLELKSTQHRLGFSYRIFDRSDLSWRSGLNFTRLVTTGHLPPTPGLPTDAWDDKPSYTGGWTNRLECHRLSLGLDLLYHFGDVFYTDGFHYFTNKEDFWLAQNIYIGYKVPMTGKTGLEVYADSRGLVRGGGNSSTSYLLNERRYYGIGGKISL